MLLSIVVSESRGDAPSLTPVSGTIFLKPLGGNSVTRCSGRVNQSGRMDSISKMISGLVVRTEDVWLDTDKRVQTANWNLTKSGHKSDWKHNNKNNTSRPSFCAVRQIKSHMNATLAKSLAAQGCEQVNYYRCSIITNHKLLGGPCVIYISMLKLMGNIFISMRRCIHSQWNPSLIYLYIFLILKSKDCLLDEFCSSRHQH